ncbi:hypothetical protein Y88_2094 [Novosphingobium nitrogenifigens DSM 19370]|uniref:Cytoskeleton protein RodZ-like C-terminal domain-containing protein n=1 Tax=Novosphingobium nitrogenifigens DSM 19370 TaxID=983920 RepID=F1Z5W0_9SPHN|nr:helix-turn-helix domain-containing protein [Novosphingobium nitrogenifigens]EGD60220.1 hypothetical protein Y88_2094 [Novosphingobium nitrogenifigens DSM 19370]
MDEARDAVPQDGAHDDKAASAVMAEVARSATPRSTPAASGSPMTATGRLRAAREALGLTTAEISERTRITLRHVEAMDRGDLAALPGRPYVLGFVRSYARVVGLDDTELGEQVRREMDISVPRPEPRPLNQYDVNDPAKTPSPLISWLAVGLVVVILVAGTVFWRSYYSPAGALPALAPSEAPAPAPSAAPVQAAPAQTAPVPSGPVVFTATADGVWVKFTDGQGHQLLQKNLARGESYTVPADAVSPQLWTGRPDALTITIGGTPVPPLADKQTVMKDVPVSAQALLARANSAPPVQPSPAQSPLAQTVPAGVQGGVAQAAPLPASTGNLSHSPRRHVRPRHVETPAVTNDGAAPATPAAVPAVAAAGTPQ